MQIHTHASPLATCVHVIWGKSEKVIKMPSTLRLSDQEQEQLRKKCTEINKLLIKQGREPLRDSELAHKILEKSMPYVRLGESGEIRIDEF